MFQHLVEPTLYDEADVQSVRPVDVLHGELVAPHVVGGEAGDDQAAGVAILPPADAVHLGLELATFNTTVIIPLQFWILCQQIPYNQRCMPLHLKLGFLHT